MGKQPFDMWQAHRRSALETGSPLPGRPSFSHDGRRLLRDMGKFAAVDFAIFNNDRFPIAGVFDNNGNFGNLMVVASTNSLVAIDQEFADVTEEAFNKHIESVRSIVDAIVSSPNTPHASFEKVRNRLNASFDTGGIELDVGAEGVVLMQLGLLEGILALAILRVSQRFDHLLDHLPTMASESIDQIARATVIHDRLRRIFEMYETFIGRIISSSGMRMNISLELMGTNGLIYPFPDESNTKM